MDSTLSISRVRLSQPAAKKARAGQQTIRSIGAEFFGIGDSDMIQRSSSRSSRAVCAERVLLGRAARLTLGDGVSRVPRRAVTS